MKRKIFYSILCTLLVLLVIFLFYARSNSHKENDLTKENNLIRIGYNIGNLNYAPFFVAYKKGFFNAHNDIQYLQTNTLLQSQPNTFCSENGSDTVYTTISIKQSI